MSSQNNEALKTGTIVISKVVADAIFNPNVNLLRPSNPYMRQ